MRTKTNEDRYRHNSVNMHDVKEEERMVHSPLDRFSGISVHQRNFVRLVGRKYYVHMHFSRSVVSYNFLFVLNGVHFVSWNGQTIL
jgi:hypothetical protein